MKFLELYAALETDLKLGSISSGSDSFNSMRSILTCGIHGNSEVRDKLMFLMNTAHLLRLSFFVFCHSFGLNLEENTQFCLDERTII